MKVIIFCLSHRVVRKNIKRFDIVQCSEKCAKLFQIFLIESDAGNNHMAYPDRNVLLIEIACKCQDTLIGVCSQFLVFFSVDMFDVKSVT